MEAKHTPAPWSKVPQTDGSTLIAHRYETGKQMNPTGLRLIGFTMARKSSMAEDEANASLIAAAPDLLEAAEAALSYDNAIQACANDPNAMSSYCTAEGDALDDLYVNWITKARAAVTKATGA